MYDSELNKLLSELRKLEKKSEQDKANKEQKTSTKKNDGLDFILNLNSNEVKNKDKDLTLSQYLQKYNQVDEIIETQKRSRGQNTGYEELLRDLEGNSAKFIEKKIDEDFDYREVKTLFSKQDTSAEDVSTKDIFTNKSKERCNNVTVRIKQYANTKSNLTTEGKMGPLKLEQFIS